MPYRWTEHNAAPDGAALHFILTAWPYRSLPKRGFVWFIGTTAALLALPLIAVVGKAVLWGLLPFMVLVLGGAWVALDRSYRSGTVSEVLDLTPDRITLTRHDPGRPDRHWQANPYWVRATLRPGPVPDYLTLTGSNAREVELGAFLTPAERQALAQQVNAALARIRSLTEAAP